jgi:transposase InsO family protein
MPDGIPSTIFPSNLSSTTSKSQLTPPYSPDPPQIALSPSSDPTPPTSTNPLLIPRQFVAAPHATSYNPFLALSSTIPSLTSHSFLVPLILPIYGKETLRALIDCAATVSFIDKNLAARRPDLIKSLRAPRRLEVFDGTPALEGALTQTVSLPILFTDGTTHTETFFVTRTHPTAPVVLGLTWLRRWNPRIDWDELTLRFNDTEPAAIIRMQLVAANPEAGHGAVELGNDDQTMRGFTPRSDDEPSSSEGRGAHIDKSPVSNHSVDETNGPSDPMSDPTRRATSARQQPIRAGSRRAKRARRPAKAREETKEPRNYAPGGLKISLVSAAAFKRLLADGEQAFTYHAIPVTETESASAAQTSSSGDEEDPMARVPPEYHDYADVFSEQEARHLPPHRPYDHKIDLEDGATLPTGCVYNMSEVELKTLKDYIDEMLGKGFIRSSRSPVGAPVLFVKKKDGSLRLCVDYRALNKITRKNKYPIPLIGNLIDRLNGAKYFTKIDLRAGYNNIRIAPGDEWKTAFRTRYGSFEYLVMPFGLTNAPATFQSFMNDIFHDLSDEFVVVYLDDILIYSNTLEEHRRHVRTVLQRLRRFNLHAKPEKCDFHVDSVEYLGVIVSPEGVKMDPSKINVIMNWPAPKTVKELQAFLGFTNFYRRFIDNYSGITVPLTRLLRKNIPWRWTERCQDVFDLLKQTFTSAPILRHFDPKLPIILECDASDYAIAAIISQVDPEDEELRPVAFHARTMIGAELNYDIYDKELLAIHDAFKHWRAYLEGAQHQIQVYSDHNNLKYFTTTKQLSRRQARWAEYLSQFDFVIHYRAGRLGTKPDALTRRPDVYPKKTGKLEVDALNHRVALPPERVSAALLLNEEALLSQIRNAPQDDLFRKGMLDAESSSDSPFAPSPDGQLLLRAGKIYVPDHEDLRLKVLQAHHDHKLRGHPGIRKTTQLIQRTYFWPRLRRDVTRYIRGCHTCARAKAVRHRPYGLLKPLPIGERPWTHLSMDYIEELPDSDGFDAILVVVDRLTKQAIFLPARTTDTATELARQFIQHVFSKHGLPISIISDRGKLFVSKFWKSLCQALDIRSDLSTAYHPETDGQTERVNQTLEQYLRIYVNYQQDDWAPQLPLAEFVYNNTPHAATGVSPFYANKGYNPRLTITLDRVPAHEAHLVAKNLRDLQEHLRGQIKVANEAYSRFADPRREQTPNWPVGTLVWLDLRNIKTKRRAKKLDHKRHGPFEVVKKVSSHAYKLKLPTAMKGIHDVFHVSLLEAVGEEYYPARQLPRPPPVETAEEGDEYEVASILDSRRKRGKVEYLVRWEGYGPEDDTWLGIEDLEGSQELLDEYHAAYPTRPSARNTKESARRKGPLQSQ